MVGDWLNDHSIRLCKENMVQRNSGVEIFACKFGATQIKSVLALSPISASGFAKLLFLLQAVLLSEETEPGSKRKKMSKEGFRVTSVLLLP